MSSYPVTRNFGKSPSDIVGSLKLKGGISELVADELLRFEIAYVEKNGTRRLIEVSLITNPAPPSASPRQWKKTNESEEKRFETYRKFINKAKTICRDELKDDGMNALDIILAKLTLFEEFMREHGDKIGVPRLTVDGFVKAASTTWGLKKVHAEKLRVSLLEVITDKIRDEIEGETT